MNQIGQMQASSETGVGRTEGLPVHDAVKDDATNDQLPQRVVHHVTGHHPALPRAVASVEPRGTGGSRAIS